MCLGFCLALGIAGDARALTDEALFRDLQFDWVRSGASTLGFGGASVALVDDATAITSNPAALRSVTSFEFVGEFRTVGGTGRDGSVGSVGSADPTGSQFPYVGGRTTSMPELDSNATFAGLAMPLPLGDQRLTFGFSRQLMLDQTRNLEDSGLEFALEGFPVWINPTGNNGGPSLETYTVSSNSTGRLDTELIRYNFGLAMSVGTDVELGATLSLSELDVASNQLTITEDPEGYLERPINPRADTDDDGVPDALMTYSRIDDGDSAVGYSVGLRYKPVSRFGGRAPFAIGLTYERGPELEVLQSIGRIDPGTGTTAIDPVTLQPAETGFGNVFRVPDRWCVGIAATPARGWLLGLDVERVEYSDLLDGMHGGADLLTSGAVDPEVLEQTGGRALKFDVDDATVVHVGGGYNLERGRWTVGFRGGYYNAPDSRVRLTGFNSDSAEINQAFLTAYGSRKADDTDHLTAGLSLATPVGLRVHLAADLSETNDRYLFSTVWRSRTR